MKKGNEELKTVEELNRETRNRLINDGYTEVNPILYGIKIREKYNFQYDSIEIIYYYNVNKDDLDLNSNEYDSIYNLIKDTAGSNFIEVNMIEVNTRDIKEIKTGFFKRIKTIKNEGDIFLIDKLTKIFFKKSDFLNLVENKNMVCREIVKDKVLKQIKTK